MPATDKAMMPPPTARVPPEVAVPQRPSDASTIATMPGTALPYQRYIAQDGMQFNIRIFVCLIHELEYTKVCILNAQQTTELVDLISLIARKFKMDHMLCQQSARLFLIQGGAHEIDGVEEIQSGDTVALDLGSNDNDVLAQNKPTPKKTPKKTRASTTPSIKKQRELDFLFEGVKNTVAFEEVMASRREPPRPSRSSTKEHKIRPVKRESAKNEATVASKKRKATPKKAGSKSKKNKVEESKKATWDPYAKAKMNAVVDLVDSDPYAVGKRFFVVDEDDGIGGNEYPAMVVNPKGAKLQENERLIQWEGYSEEKIVKLDQLLPYTKERIAYHENVVVPMLQNAQCRENTETPLRPEEVTLGEIYYYKEGDNIAYPVKVMRQLKNHNDRVEIKFLDYRTTKNVWKSELLAATPDLEERYDVEKKLREQKRLDEKNKRLAKEMRKKIKKEDVSSDPSASRPEAKTNPLPSASKPKETKSKATKPKATKALPSASSSAPSLITYDAGFEPAVDITNLPSIKKVKKVGYGNYIRQEHRIVYICRDSETFRDVADKFQVPIGKVYYDNRRKWKSCRETSRMAKGSPIVLPLEWQGKRTKMVTASTDRNDCGGSNNRTALQSSNQAEESSDLDFDEPTMNQSLPSSDHQEQPEGEQESSGTPAVHGDDDDHSVATRASSDWSDEDIKDHPKL